MKTLFAFCFLSFAFSMAIFAEDAPKPSLPPLLTSEEKARLQQINQEFDQAKLEQEIIRLKQALQQERFLRLQSELRLRYKCDSGTLNAQTAEFSCPPPPTPPPEPPKKD